MFAITQNYLFFLYAPRHTLSISLPLPAMSSLLLLFVLLPPPTFTSFISSRHSLTSLALHRLLSFSPFPSATSPSSSLLFSLSSPPLRRPHQRSKSLVSLSLGWHREQADTWEGCFVIQQVIPPWQMGRGGGGLGLMGRREGGESQAYTTTFQPIPLLHPSVCKLMVSPFFPTDNRRSRLTTSSKRVEVLGAS